jgi:hypothetical protein
MDTAPATANRQQHSLCAHADPVHMADGSASDLPAFSRSRFVWFAYFVVKGIIVAHYLWQCFHTVEILLMPCAENPDTLA